MVGSGIFILYRQNRRFLICYFADEKSILKNVLIFSLNALLLEAAKYNVNESVVISLLQENSIDSTTDNFKLFSNFVHDTLKLVRHNMHNLQLNPVPNFNDLEWSQIFDLKSSSVDNIKEKSYLVDFQTDIASGQKQVFSMTFSHKELQDLHATLRDCVKNVECFLNNK